uniref:Aminoacyl tRNA synthetase complex interacting multifunctional protein 1b n=1 Tax=Amphilophus citrinellus TaxID=61819 RepID=A0A3Q0T2C0_AMPCI
MKVNSSSRSVAVIMSVSLFVLSVSLEAAVMKLDPEDGEQIMEYFKTHALLSREKALLQASVREQKKLLVENAKLKKDIEQLKTQLQEKQRRRADSLLYNFQTQCLLSPKRSRRSVFSPFRAGVPMSLVEVALLCWAMRRGERKGVSTAPSTSDLLSLGAESRVDVSRLDLRVGRILSVRHHPLAEAMFVQEVDVGENGPRTVVSKKSPLSVSLQLQGSLAVLLCNVKACKLKGVVSQARLLCCCTSDDCIEPLFPPTGSAPGDRVTFLNYPGEPDRELQSKQKVWELLQPDLQVDGRGVANYKGCSFEVKGKGLCRAPSLTNCIIR